MAENLDLVLRVRADLEAAIRQFDRLAEGADRLGTAFTRAGFSPPRHPPTPAVMSARKGVPNTLGADPRTPEPEKIRPRRLSFAHHHTCESRQPSTRSR